MSDTTVTVVVTGTSWMGAGVGSVESALERIFREARQTISLTVFSITGGADLLFGWLESALARGVVIRLAINDADRQDQDVMRRLLALSSSYGHLHLYTFIADADADLHAKAVVADARLALIGSSNLSRRGLLTNHEIAVLLEGAAAAVASGVLDRLFASRHVVRVSDVSQSC